MRRHRLLAIVAVIALAGCSAATQGEGYDLVEFAIEGPSELDAGARDLTVTNSGQFAHTLVVSDSDGAVVGTTPLIDPGEAVEIALDLEPGREYSFTCRIVVQTPDGELVDHYEEGMATSVRVRG